MNQRRSDGTHHAGSKRAQFLSATLLVASLSACVVAQEQSLAPVPSVNVAIAVRSDTGQQSQGLPTKRSLTISDAVAIFLRQNLDLVAARYDVAPASLTACLDAYSRALLAAGHAHTLDRLADALGVGDGHRLTAA